MQTVYRICPSTAGSNPQDSVIDLARNWIDPSGPAERRSGGATAADRRLHKQDPARSVRPQARPGAWQPARELEGSSGESRGIQSTNAPELPALVRPPEQYKMGEPVPSTVGPPPQPPSRWGLGRGAEGLKSRGSRGCPGPDGLRASRSSRIVLRGLLWEGCEVFHRLP